MPFLDKLSGGLLQARAHQAFASRNAALLDRAPFSPAGQDTYQPSRSHCATRLTQNQPCCGGSACGGSWFESWKNRRRPFFEGEWACSTRCLEAMVRASIRREVGEIASDEGVSPHRHRVPLGLVLLAQGWITHAQLQSALQAQRSSGHGRIGDWLVEGCGIPAEQITRGLGVQWNCPVLSLDGFSPSAMALVMPPVLLEQLGLIPLRTAGRGLLYIAFEASMNAAAALAVERMTGLRVECGLLGASDFSQAYARLMDSDCVPVEHAFVPDADSLCAAVTRAIEQHQPVASRVVRVRHWYWLRLWLERGAQSGIGDVPPDQHDMRDYLLAIGPRRGSEN